MLHAVNIKVGRFTSPHLIDRWDCITIEEKTVDESKFRKAEDAVKLRNATEQIKASEFELLTATAFELFALEKVKVGVIEVGVGGRDDATNVIQRPLVTVITSISTDHQSLLGNSIEEIASHKAGIMKHGVPCLVDATNPERVFRVLEANAREVGAHPLERFPSGASEAMVDLQNVISKNDLERHQQVNLTLAYQAAIIAVQQIAPTVHLPALLVGAGETFWPGRLQTVHIEALTGRLEPVILDGAHNAASAEVLSSFVKRRIRMNSRPVTWVIAASVGKNVRELLSRLFQSKDNFVAVEFGPVAGMPWVSPVDADSLVHEARSLGLEGSIENAGKDVRGALRLAADTAAGNPIVIGGSLYLVSDVLRLLRDSEGAKHEALHT
ncbi:MAG: hypothetical protein L6R40_002668 [Gallowayella cf. fulva]|nr:MAG: hypothetical protein L6R40_002668 [Xanthomendoza cf. fulva]